MRFVKASFLKPGPEIVEVHESEIAEFEHDPVAFLREHVGWPALLDDYEEVDDQ